MRMGRWDGRLAARGEVVFVSELHLGSVSVAAVLGELAADRQRDGSFSGRGKVSQFGDCECCTVLFRSECQTWCLSMELAA